MIAPIMPPLIFDCEYSSIITAWEVSVISFMELKCQCACVLNRLAIITARYRRIHRRFFAASVTSYPPQIEDLPSSISIDVDGDSRMAVILPLRLSRPAGAVVAIRHSKCHGSAMRLGADIWRLVPAIAHTFLYSEEPSERKRLQDRSISSDHPKRRSIGFVKTCRQAGIVPLQMIRCEV